MGELHGEASATAQPEGRLRVVAFFTGAIEPGLVLDLVDMVETACDVIGDQLGLTEDEVQRAFNDIRKEYDLGVALGLGAAACFQEGSTDTALTADAATYH